MAYEVVDLRGRFCPADSSWDSSTKDWGVVVHWNGPTVPAWAYNDMLGWIEMISDLHAEPGRFAQGWTFNGVAYHEFVWKNTVYRLRNYGATLPHCGNHDWNYHSLALHVPVGEGQRADARTLQTLAERTKDHLDAMKLGRASVKGHREVGPSECPGTLQNDFVLAYRSGKLSGGTTPPPPPTGTLTRLKVPAQQVAALSTEIRADKLNNDLIGAGVPGAKIVRVAEGGFHKVRLLAYQHGAYGTKAKLDENRNKLTNLGVKTTTEPTQGGVTVPPKKTYAAADFAVLNDFRMWPAAARDCARIANEFGLTPAVFSTYSNNQGRHGDAPPGGSVDILISDRYGKWANEHQLAFGKRIVRWLYGEYDSGRMPLDYVVWNKVYNHFNGLGDQPYDPRWSLGKSPVSDDHGDHIHITWLA